MKAEIIAVGTELLLGDVVNTNAAWLSKELAAIGVDVYHHTTVGDNPARIQAIIAQALARNPESRADILLFSGGLGPTDDDLTVETIASYFHTPLVSDADSVTAIRRIFEARQLAMPDSNLKQALKPQGAQTLNNPLGTAPGILWEIPANQCTQRNKSLFIVTFPGVPRELYVMWPAVKTFIQNAQQALGETPSVIDTVFLNFFGVGESTLLERFGKTPELSALLENANPTVAPYVGKGGEVRLRIAAKAASEEAAKKLIVPVKAVILKHCAAYYIGDGDVSLEAVVAETLIQKGLGIAVAESCTGGLLSSRLTDVPGSSAYTTLNVVTYANSQKHKLLGVSQADLKRFGAVSEPVAKQMAEGVKRLSGSDIGLSLTGIAGPDGGSEEKPVGLLYIGLCGPDGKVETFKIQLNPNYGKLKDGRKDVKFLFSQHALNILRQYLQQQDWQ